MRRQRRGNPVGCGEKVGATLAVALQRSPLKARRKTTTERYDPQKHARRSIRLPGYEYTSPGAYFVTLCTRGRVCVLDDPVVTGIITDVWHALPGWFTTIALDEFVVMPNHVHFIVWLHGEEVGATDAATAGASGGASAREATVRVAPTGDAGAALWAIPEPKTVNSNPTLGQVMGAFQSLVFTVYLGWIQAHDPARRAKFWQRNYYDHIIRNNRELQAIRRYIRDNPAQWALDRDNPDNLHRLPPPTRVEDYLADLLDVGEGAAVKRATAKRATARGATARVAPTGDVGAGVDPDHGDVTLTGDVDAGTGF